MFVYRLASDVVVRAPAKLNLFFEVLGKRNDGYHEIETLMAPVDLFDALHFAPSADGELRVACRWAGPTRGDETALLGELPPEAGNLATRAIELLRSRAGVTGGARVRLEKRIPSAAGLGGGSSDAAAALLAANYGWKLGWSRARLAALSAELGSDIPFFFSPRAAVCRGRGEQIADAGALGRLHFVIARPPAGLSTAGVYARCRPAEEPRRVEPLIGAMRSGDMRAIARLLHNRLEPAAAELSPWIGRLKAEFARAGCAAAQMSGSGSSYFGICRHARHARTVAERLRARGVGRVLVARSHTSAETN